MATKKTKVTEFPAKVELATHTSSTSETTGAFGVMELSTSSSGTPVSSPPRRPPLPIIHRQPPPPSAPIQQHHPTSNNGSLDSTVKFRENDKFLTTRNGDDDDDGLPGIVYKTTLTGSDVSGNSSSRRAVDKMVEVYSNSGDTVEFAVNISKVIDSIVSPMIWIGIFVSLAIYGLIMIIMGSFNIHYCTVNVMIPIYLIVGGSVIILVCSLRIYSSWPVPASRNHQSLPMTLSCKIIEGCILLFLLVWLILGCIWIYGAQRTVAHATDLFDYHYCEWTLYWFSWWTVTLQLIFVGIILLALFALVFIGFYKDSNQGRSLR